MENESSTLEIKKQTQEIDPIAQEEEEEVQDVEDLTPSQLRNRALSLRRKINMAAIELAEVIHRIYHSEAWKEFGYETFKEYTESELEIGYRSAMYSVRIVATMRTHNITMTQAKQLGWGRLRAILPHITERNVGSLLSMASEKSVREIESNFSETEDSAIPETHNIIVKCSASEASVIFDAIDEAKRRLDTDSTSSALEFLAQEWLFANEGEVSQLSLDDIIKFCDRNYGIKVAPIDGSSQNLQERT